MTPFSVAGHTIRLPASQVLRANTTQIDAWLRGEWLTVRLTAPVNGIRVHTNGRAQLENDRVWERPASQAVGAWAAIGDVILTATQMIDASALPGPFTAVANVVIPKGCIVNIGINGQTLMGRGGGVQVEYVKGPLFEFVQLSNKHWMNRAGSA